MTKITPSGSRATLAVTFCFLCALPTPGRSAAFQARWNELASLVAGQEATIPLPGGGVVTGEVVSVRADSLALDVHKVSGGRERYAGLVSIPRTSVTTLHAIKMRGSWGRRIGVLVGQVGGIIGGAEFAVHVGRSEAGGVSSFFAIDMGATVAGYYLGKAKDRRTVEIEIVPDPPAENRTAEPRPTAFSRTVSLPRFGEQ